MRLLVCLSLLCLALGVVHVNAICADENQLYTMICPQEKADAIYEEWKKFDNSGDAGSASASSAPPSPRQAEAMKKELESLNKEFEAQSQNILSGVALDAKIFFDKIGVDGAKQSALILNPQVFTLHGQLGEFTAASPGFLLIGHAEAAVSRTQRGYMRFAVGHEVGHVMDVVADAGTDQHKEARKAKLGAIRHAITTKWGNRAKEVWADFFSASIFSGNKTSMLEAILPLCRGSSNKRFYPDTKDRVMMIARHPHFYSTLCKKNDNTIDTGARGEPFRHWFPTSCKNLLDAAKCAALTLDNNSVCKWENKECKPVAAGAVELLEEEAILRNNH